MRTARSELTAYVERMREAANEHRATANTLRNESYVAEGRAIECDRLADDIAALIPADLST